MGGSAPATRHYSISIVVVVVVHNFQPSLAKLSQISYGVSLGMGNKSLYEWSSSLAQDCHHASIR